jgi:ribonuclease HII
MKKVDDLLNEVSERRMIAKEYRDALLKLLRIKHPGVKFQWINSRLIIERGTNTN